MVKNQDNARHIVRLCADLSAAIVIQGWRWLRVHTGRLPLVARIRWKVDSFSILYDDFRIGRDGYEKWVQEGPARCDRCAGVR